MLKNKIIAVDFDGTLCENKWPDIGEPNSEVIDYLKQEREKGTKLVLWTCRAGSKLREAIRWCYEHGLMFQAFNENLPEAVVEFGSDTRKIFAHEYIDDKMCGKFNLPYVKLNRGITDEVITKLERIFGFTLYDWQKLYLKGDVSSIEMEEAKYLFLCDRKACERHCSLECNHTNDVKHAKNFELSCDGKYFVEKPRPLVVLQCNSVIKDETMDLIRKRIMMEIQDNVIIVSAGMKALTIETGDNETLVFDVQLVKGELK